MKGRPGSRDQNLAINAAQVAMVLLIRPGQMQVADMDPGTYDFIPRPLEHHPAPPSLSRSDLQDSEAVPPGLEHRRQSR